MRKILFLSVLILTLAACLDQKQQAEAILRHYIKRKVEPIRNYSMESAAALWDATVTGNESDYQKLIDIELKFNKMNQNNSDLFYPDRFSTLSQNVYTDEQDFELLRKLKYSGLITDTLLARQLNVLYQTFMGSQIEDEKYKKLMVNEIKLWQAFSNLKVANKGKFYGSSQIDSIRKYSNDGVLIKKISDAYQQMGRQIAPDIVRMVRDRNEFAKRFGYPDFYNLAIESNDQTQERIKVLLDEIELKTRDQYFEAKRIIDKMLAKRFNVAVNELEPYFYNEERDSYLPMRFTVKLDSLFVGKDPVKLASDFFEGIGLPIRDVIKNSRLEDAPGRSNLTAMINVDFKNDIRLIAGITNTHDGMMRMMHLGGHAAQYKSISDQIPYLLKTPNILITDGIARYFENLASDYKWLSSEVSIDDKMQKQLVLVCQHLHEVDRLFRCRKLLVMAEFEREIYLDPNQDLDLLWHNLNLKYLGINYPPDTNACFWATNRFASSLSCNVHNYVLADVFAVQLQHSIQTRVLRDTAVTIVNNKDIGKFLVDNLFRYGNLLPWEELIEKATGEPLNSTYFVDELVGDENDVRK